MLKLDSRLLGNDKRSVLGNDKRSILGNDRGLTLEATRECRDNDAYIVDTAGEIVNAGSGWTDGGSAGGCHTYTQGAATLLIAGDIDLATPL